MRFTIRITPNLLTISQDCFLFLQLPLNVFDSPTSLLETVPEWLSDCALSNQTRVFLEALCRMPRSSIKIRQKTGALRNQGNPQPPHDQLGSFSFPPTPFEYFRFPMKLMSNAPIKRSLPHCLITTQRNLVSFYLLAKCVDFLQTD